jgi:4-hydroxy-4-methyl-2-oxoglutarate aldolase
MTDKTKIMNTVMQTLKQVTTGMVVDALAISGIQGGITGIRPVRGFEDSKIIGPAVTVLYAPARPDSPKLNNYRVIRESKPGSVLVIDGKGIEGHFTGDNQAVCAKKQELEAVVVYGGARDIAGYRQVGMPLYCTVSATRNKPAEFKLSAYNVPVEIGGVLVKPGDIMVADEDGLAVIPVESLASFMENIEIMFEVEAGMEQAISNGAAVEEISKILSKKRYRGHSR